VRDIRATRRYYTPHHRQLAAEGRNVLRGGGVLLYMDHLAAPLLGLLRLGAQAEDSVVVGVSSQPHFDQHDSLVGAPRLRLPRQWWAYEQLCVRVTDGAIYVSSPVVLSMCGMLRSSTSDQLAGRRAYNSITCKEAVSCGAALKLQRATPWGAPGSCGRRLRRCC
jgi:hypothetical protein